MAVSFAVCDAAPPEMFATMFQELQAESAAVIGAPCPRPLVIPLRDDLGGVAGGLWGVTCYAWLHVQMLFVPRLLRGQGVGAALMAAAEAEARARCCVGVHVDAFSFQAGGFYRALGFSEVGVLADCPPGHSQLYFAKRIG